MNGDVHQLAGAYALDAIDDDLERRRFEDHLDECSACWEEVRSFVETTARLAGAAAVAPPPALRARVLAGIEHTPQLPPPVPGRERARGDARRPRRTRPDGRAQGRGRAFEQPRRRTPVAAAVVVLALASGGLAGLGALQLSRARDAGQQAERILAIAADPAAKRATGKVTGGGQATVILAGAQAAVVVDGAGALANDRAYQLWLIRPGAIVSAGLGPAGAAGAGRWSRLIGDVRAGDKVAVSVEPAGGSVQPTTKPVAVLDT